jgi:subtilase family serine protease
VFSARIVRSTQVARYLDLQSAKGTLPPAHKWRREGSRGIPDVASLAGNLVVLTNGEVWLGGGTSAAAPFWGGVWALATAVSRATCGRPLGPANPLLYELSRSRPECFYDVTKGDNRCWPPTPRWSHERATIRVTRLYNLHVLYLGMEPAPSKWR